MNSLEGGRVELASQQVFSRDDCERMSKISKSISQSSHMLHLVCWNLDFGFV